MNIDYGQETLFGKKIISTIGYNEQEIIRDILFLHAYGKPIDCDPTFSIGNFYKKGIPEPKWKFDKYPQREDVVSASSDNLPLEDGSCNVIMFDPPFVMSGENYNETKSGSGIISKRFTAFKTFEELKQMYSSSLKEFHRILKDGGIVIFKCQDAVVCQKNHFTHCWVIYQAIHQGFYPKDMFILFAKNRLNDGRKQQHGRKYHSYFLVFEKRMCPVNYLVKP
jgi:hypothetical protein